MKREIDKFDEEILTAAAGRNARESVKTIASQVFLSSPAVSARIERLENDGVISGYHADVNPEFFGYHIKAFHQSGSTRRKAKRPFIRLYASCPNVVECNCVTGDFSMLIEVLFPRTDDLDLFIGQACSASGGRGRRLSFRPWSITGASIADKLSSER